MLTRASGPGFFGIGCVAGYHSPGTSAFACGRSSTPCTGVPFSRFRMNMKPDFPTCASAGIVLPSFLMSIETGRGRQVVVPHLVADVLEVPLQLARLRVERDRRVAEQVVAGPIAAVVVHARTADRHVDEAALLVDGQRERPDVVAGAILPAVVAPRVVADFAGQGNGVEVPHLLARARVVGVHVALLALARREVRSDVPLAGPEEIGSHQHDVPVDRRHAGVRDLQIDVTAVAERRRPARRCRRAGRSASAGW